MIEVLQKIYYFKGDIMKKMIYLPILGLFTAGTVMSATTGTLQLNGVVALEVAIVVNSSVAASNLDLSATQTDLVVGSVDETSNSATGYKISVSSANAGKLLLAGGNENVAYTFKYDGVAVALSTTAVEAKVVTTAGVVADNSPLSISYTGAPASTMTAGAYQDTLSFEIAAN